MSSFEKKAIGYFFFIFLSLPLVTNAFPSRVPELQIVDFQKRTLASSWSVFPRDYRGGIAVATAPMDNKPGDELVVGQDGGQDAKGLVRIFSADKLLREFLAFPEGAEQAEMSLAVGNLNQDALAEIVVSTPRGLANTVFIFNAEGKLAPGTVGAFVPFPELTAGVSVAVGNVVGDEDLEIIAGTGAGAEPKVRIFNAQGEELTAEFFPFPADQKFGLSLAEIKEPAGQNDALAVGFLNGGKTQVKLYQIIPHQAYPVLADFSAWTKEFLSGVKLGGIDVDNDGRAEIAVAPLNDQQAEIRFFTQEGQRINITPFQFYEEDFLGGINFVVADTDQNNLPEFIIAPRYQRQLGDFSFGNKYIEVDLSEQVMHAWEGGYLRKSFLVSTGLPGTPTPVGHWSILFKIASHVYDGRPAYYFPNTPWNLRYKAGGPESNYYFHTAYWHNNFGHPMSHGCVNMREADAKWTYFWADIGTPAWIHP